MRTAGCRWVKARALSLWVVCALVLGAGAPSDAVAVGGTAVIAGSENGANLRAEASYGAAVLTALATGTVVELRIDETDTVYDPDGVTRWWPVRVYGVDGWIAGFYLDTDLAGGTEAPPAEVAAPSDAGSGLQTPTGSTVYVTSPDGVNFRAEPSSASSVLAALGSGTVLDLRIDQVDTVYDADGIRWWPVRYAGQEGWVAGTYLANAWEEAAVAAEPVAAPAFAAGQYVAAVTASGMGVNVRAAASPEGELVGYIPEGNVVQIVEGPAGFDRSAVGWYLVTDGGVTGYADGDLLQVAAQPAPPAPASEPEPAPAVSEEPVAPEIVYDEVRFAAGDYAAASTASGLGVNLRAEGWPDATLVGYIPEAGVVQVLDGPYYDETGNGWYLVANGEVEAFADGDLLVAATPPAPAPEPEPAPVVDVVEPAPEIIYDAVRFAAGDYVAASTASGLGVNLRAEAWLGAGLVGYIPEAGIVQVLDGPYYDGNGTGWYLVSDGLVEAFADGNLLVASAPPAPEPEPEPVWVEPAPEPAPAPVVSGPTGYFIYPVANSTFTQAYGCSPYAFEPWDSYLGCNFHNGIDLAAPSYTPIVASDGGTVVAAGWCDCGLGYYVAIDHGNGFETVYGHMAEQPYVYVGQVVGQGEVIGPMGSTGLSTGPHVHFMLKLNGSTVDPLAYL